MAASEDEAKPKPARAKKLTKKEKDAKEALEAEEAALSAVWSKAELDDPQEVKETHQILHGNVRQRNRHGMKYTMFSARFSPDGYYLATASSDKSMCLWDALTGNEVANYEHPDFVRCVTFSPDGLRIVSGCDSREVRIWDVEEKILITEPLWTHKHRDWIVCVCYSPDGKWLCTVSKDQSVQIHDVRAVFDKMDIRKASKERRGSKGILKFEAPEEYHPVKLPLEGQTLAASFSRDSQLLVCASSWSNGLAVIFDVASWDHVLDIPHPDWVTSCSFNPGNTCILTTSRDKIARVWELPSDMKYGESLQAVKDERKRIEDEKKAAQEGIKILRISKKKQKDMAEAEAQAARAVKLHSQEIMRFSQKNWTLCSAWSQSGRRVAMGSDTGCVEIFEVSTGEQLIRLEKEEPIIDISFSPTDRKVCVSSSDGSARIYGGLRTLWNHHDIKIEAAAASKKKAKSKGFDDD